MSSYRKSNPSLKVFFIVDRLKAESIQKCLNESKGIGKLIGSYIYWIEMKNMYCKANRSEGLSCVNSVCKSIM